MLYPPRCPICDAVLPISGGLICADCREHLPWVKNPCMKCGKPVESARIEYCPDCRRMPHLFTEGRAAFSYTGGMRSSVYRMKAENRRDYLDFYAASMVGACRTELERWRPQLIVPIPMHAKKRAARGFNQAELLAAKISRLSGIPCKKRALRSVRETPNQKTLPARERRKNLKGAFALSPAEADLPARVLLVDDIYTTGSTMDEASRVLLEAGVREVFFLVLCTGRGE